MPVFCIQNFHSNLTHFHFFVHITRMAGTEASINGFYDYPKNSFQSWGNYFQALMEIPHRLLDRIMSRSLDQTKLGGVKAESQHEMKKTLTWWDLIWFGMGAVIVSGIFVLTGLETQSHAGPAVVLCYPWNLCLDFCFLLH